MKLVDFLNIWGLILIGLSLFAGLLIRWSSIAGAILLLFYYVAYPPVPGYTFGSVTEGSYLWINKTLIEFFILLIFTALPVDFFFGFDRWIRRWKDEKAHVPAPTVKEGTSFQRREMLRDLISVPIIGAFAYATYKKKKWDSFEEKFMTGKPDVTSGPTLKSFQFASIADLKGELPKGLIGDLGLRRLIMGGNLIGGWAHARDLVYVSKLVKAYHTDERMMITLQIAERCGVNAIITNPSLGRIMNKYWHETGGKIKFISDCGHKDGFLEGTRQTQHAGASAMYCQGGDAYRLVMASKFDVIRKGLELIQSYGKPAGVGAHRIETIQECVKLGIKPDFWVKTLHELNYWSAQVDTDRKEPIERGFQDNIFCLKPQETIDFMNGLEETWIAFKVLAAGAIEPKDGFQCAFDNGADFIFVGMYDFQIVDDCNIALNSLTNIKRARPWRG
ncbi:MAG: hypothetical protein M0R21_12790 [Lentimicrobiaceae bacterium]|nr:hypothetical protein [Lentimicrobiaceae bacterium]